MICFDSCYVIHRNNICYEYKFTGGILYVHHSYTNREFVKGSYQLLLAGQDSSYFVATLLFDSLDEAPEQSEIVEFLVNSCFEDEKSLKQSLHDTYGFF